MTLHPMAGKPAPTKLLIDVAQLERECYERTPDLGNPDQIAADAPALTAGDSAKRKKDKNVASILGS
jgi:hypothetical protein